MLIDRRIQQRAEDIKITSPKRPRRGRRPWDRFFGYYAGFPEEFADSVLSGLQLPPTSKILDPWNGSGTTTFTASKLGLKSTGTDINPVMIVTARARAIAPNDIGSIVPLGKQIVAHCKRNHLNTQNNDPLLDWFSPKSAASLRCIESSVSAFFLNRIKDVSKNRVTSATLPTLACAFYVALFCVCRELTAALRSTNPTWLKKCKDLDQRVNLSFTEILKCFSEAVSALSSVLDQNNISSALHAPRLLECDSARMKLGRSRFDLVLTSPPYCTRLDYASATRLELAVLAPLLNLNTDALSSSMMGSVKVPAMTLAPRNHWGSDCLDFLATVRNHASKASSTYYFKTHIDYFIKLDDSLRSISGLLRENALAVVVAQDSYYKDVHNDLPSMASKLAEHHGLAELRRENFVVSQTMAVRHPGARLYSKPKPAQESVLFFSKLADTRR